MTARRTPGTSQRVRPHQHLFFFPWQEDDPDLKSLLVSVAVGSLDAQCLLVVWPRMVGDFAHHSCLSSLLIGNNPRKKHGAQISVTLKL